MTEHEPIKVGIAGLGRSGWGIHANAISHLPEHFTVTAICDPNKDRQEEANERFHCPAYDGIADLITDDNIDLVVVATPSHLHADDAIAAMRAGKHVIVEKPMAIDLAGVEAMMAVAEETGQILTVNQNYRYHASFLKIQEILDDEVLGDLIQINFTGGGFRRRWDWQTLKQYGGGDLNNKGAHTVDWAMLMIDDPEPEVFCHMVTTPLFAGDAESHVKIILKPKTGPLIDIELVNACAYARPDCIIMGTQGTLFQERNLIHWQYFLPEKVPPLVLDPEPTPDRSYNSEKLPWLEGRFEVERNFGGGMLDLYKDLYATIRDDAPLVITPESVRRQVAVLERCRALSPV